MWNSEKSARLSCLFVYIFGAAFLVAEITAPFLIKAFIVVFAKSEALQIPLTAFLYTLLLPVFFALLALHNLLRSVMQKHTFCEENVVRLRWLSWCCFTVAAIACGYGFFYLPLFIIAPLAAFVGLVVRVIKNAFETALFLQTENSLTI